MKYKSINRVDKLPDDVEVIWSPQPRQEKALKSRVTEMFMGGAKGGGKTDFLLADFFQHAMEYGSKARGIIFRRTYNELEEIIARSKEIYIGYKYLETKKQWTINGATLKMRFLDKDADVSKYQGHQYSWIGFDELTEFDTDYCYTFMFSCLRSVSGIPCYIRATGNPGRPGHMWVKARFIDPAPPETVIYDENTGLNRIFIPSMLDDNMLMMQKDPQYEHRLKALPDYLYQAFRFGSWDIVHGAVFSDMKTNIHMIRTVKPPEWLEEIFDFEKMTPKPEFKVFRSYDWGFAKPSAVLWGFCDYDGRLYIYRELYFHDAQHTSTGSRMITRDQARLIKKIEDEHNETERLDICVADASIWDKPTNQNIKSEQMPSNAEIMESEGIFFDRQLSIDAKKSKLQGIQQIHDRLRLDEYERPYLYIFDTCRHFWRTVPMLQANPLDPEIYDTTGEDHLADALRYMCSSRPLQRKEEKTYVNNKSCEYIWRKYGSRREVYGYY